MKLGHERGRAHFRVSIEGRRMCGVRGSCVWIELVDVNHWIGLRIGVQWSPDYPKTNFNAFFPLDEATNEHIDVQSDSRHPRW